MNKKLSNYSRSMRVDTEIFFPVLENFMKENDIDSVRRATKEMGKIFKEMRYMKSKVKKPQIKF